MMAGNTTTTIPKDTAAWLNLSFTGKNKNLDQLAQQIEQALKADGYKTQALKAPIGNVVQAQKAGVLRGIVDANRAFSILISGQPNDFSVHIGIGKWLQNAGVAVAESLLFALSLTFTSKVSVVVLVGVPESSPEALREKPVTGVVSVQV